ncbi:ABC transporter substrate-binding protein [Paraburkholderia sp. BL9I2N2]|uniref:ABC transporter substrate-binding protein n=1 Tax=Paraburkholderia sp. BL9I2N2 TaxID=1938809 RepID=UPI00104F91C2|nr:ABC transporter substrate-binding protein [Paraburkholderia sp. BL9I2N2]TCK84128.1 putative spermidine/putrescine transport system substrate-binding protein [Paraburkholderia sp. BL9I2N2]
MSGTCNLRRRTVLQSFAGLALAPALSPAFGQSDKRIIVTDPGGPYSPAYRKAFYDPFEKATGIRVVSAARESQPLAQFSAMVETKNYIWDVTTLTLSADVLRLESRGFLEPIGLNGAEMPGLLASAVRPDWLGVNVYGTVLSYRKDRYGVSAPRSMRDFWDVQKFPGRRAMRRSPLDSLEQALMADGVPADKLYPLDVDRAFRSLDRIKPHVAVWWTSGAQATQLLQTGDADMVITWSSRAQTAIDNGAPVEIVWNQGTYAIEGWGIPRGTPRAEYAKAFVKFCADPARQAVLANSVAAGPTNRRAFEFISPARSAILPTAPDNLKQEVNVNAAWWDKNREAVTERFDTWLIG